jgi:phosphoglycolate phosphatase
MVKLVAFDLDGTIGDTIPMCIHTFRKAVGHWLHERSVCVNDNYQNHYI